MRYLILVGCAALALSACNKGDKAESTRQDADIASEDIRGNDVTAIDAATNDAANMAADAEIMINDMNMASDSNEAGNTLEGNGL